MTAPLLTTKLYIPPPRPNAVLRPRLLARLDAGLQGKLTLISAPAGFGKTTLASTWVSMCQRPVAWLALDAGDNDPLCFLTYVTAAMQRIAPGLGQGVMRGLRSPQPLPIAALQTALVNEFVTLTEPAILVLDDYHVLESADVGAVLAFLLDHLPPPLHLVIATREDPPLPLARLRARGQLHEVRGTDLRFTRDEAAAFLEHCMGLKLTAEHLAALEERTEGWIAGLQLAAISMQGSPQDTDSFIQAFTGSHRFVMDYLVEEVLQQQPAAVQTFLLRTAILERLCGPLCDAVVGAGATTGQETLAWLERANLFLVPLDDERRWYRYHHLFGDLLRQRLLQSDPDAMNALHIRASQWFEANNLELEAFHHAVAAHDTDRAARLAAGRGMPLLFRGAIAPVLNWLAALPHAALDLRPALWVMYASALLFVSRIAGIEEKLQAAEAALQHVELDARSRDLIGHIALIRATVAVSQHQAETIVAQARRALEYLHPENLPVRTAATWALGYAHQLRKERGAARQAYTAAIAASQSIGHFIITLMATIGLGAVQESDTELDTAAETYRRAIDLAGDPPQPTVCDAHLGLARIAYARNELDAAATHAQRSLHLAQQIEKTDRFISSQV
ncbi:LuxR family transcriptional regulator, partial [Caldilinea sp.]|uniref:LuxR family transcriptional regulator n=1 Tax=Caldilinea sp. TaxID=2293560 RepID=UPI002CB78827|nr:hypothetical protein [Caldilinea sp.]